VITLVSLSREVAVSLSFLFFGSAILYSVYNLNIVEGVNAIYTHNYIVPNYVTSVLFDWRGFDTLGECLILITSVMVIGLVFGRGLLNNTFLKEVYMNENNKYDGYGINLTGFTPIIKVLAIPMSIVLMVLGVLIILGGHLTPGGGFQGGSLIAGAYILAIVSYGLIKNPIDFNHHFLEKLETFGALTFMILGLVGMFVSGYYLFNFDSLFGYNIFPSPNNVGYVGIIPYLNIGVGLKVLAGLSTITFLITGEKVVFDNIKNDDY